LDGVPNHDKRSHNKAKNTKLAPLSPSCRQHVGDMSGTILVNVGLFPIDTRVDLTQKSPQHTQFISITANKFKSAQTYQLLQLQVTELPYLTDMWGKADMSCHFGHPCQHNI
jgi:hypothetical protein